jgi:hypothetical protein
MYMPFGLLAPEYLNYLTLSVPDEGLFHKLAVRSILILDIYIFISVDTYHTLQNCYFQPWV